MPLNAHSYYNETLTKYTKNVPGNGLYKNDRYDTNSGVAGRPADCQTFETQDNAKVQKNLASD